MATLHAVGNIDMVIVAHILRGNYVKAILEVLLLALRSGASKMP